MELFKYVPRIATDCAVLNDKGEVLLVKRNHEPFKGKWAIPGGFMEMGETCEMSALRECLEESGIRAKIISIIGVYSNPGRDPRGHVVSIAYLAKPISGKPGPSDETSDARFFPMNKLPALAADHGKIIKDAKKLL